MNYKKYSDKEILESYTTMMDYSGKADKDILLEIESRGGIDTLKVRIKEADKIPNEIKRIGKEFFKIQQENPNLNVDDIKNLITSELVSEKEKNQVIDLNYRNFSKLKKDEKITTRTIIGSIIGSLISILIGTIILYNSVISTSKIFYAVPVFIFGIAYLLIRLFTKQSSNNIIVFLASMLSAIIATVLGLYLISTQTN